MLTNNQIVLEQELLGSIFKNNNLMLKAREKIKPEMFLYSKHMNIYLGILDMVANKLEVDLITFLEHHKKRIGDMDGVTYVTEIYTCSASDIGFNTKLDMLVNNYKRHLYVEMKDKINSDMSLEEIESEVEGVKVKVHKCNIKKELDIDKQYDDYINWLY
ncbi:MAG: DnaB-like helicase N-terminal domain-containing protein, partial [Romboutsia timonensis]